MKKMIVAALALCLAVSAFAGIGVVWTAQNWGIYLNGTEEFSPDAYDTLALSQTDVFWQLIFSPDATKDAIDLTNDDYVSGDDQVLANRLISQDTTGSWEGTVNASDGTEWMVCGINMGGDAILYADESWTTAGYVYQRVFGGTPANGVWYFESEIQALSLAYNPMDPGSTQSFSIDSEDKGAVLDNQISGVPEPATMSLLGLGALAMVLRRKMSK